MGEAVKGIPPELRGLAPEVPWTGIIGMRNVLVHGYFEIDGNLVWQVVARDVAPLRRGVEALLRRIP